MYIHGLLWTAHIYNTEPEKQFKEWISFTRLPFHSFKSNINAAWRSDATVSRLFLTYMILTEQR